MEEKREHLTKVLSNIPVDPDVVHALAELMYTAYETGILHFKMRGDYEIILKLVFLANLYKDNVPDNLRM